jgi:pyridoxine 4-dehydrogenase
VHVAILCNPSVWLPEYTISMDDNFGFLPSLHADYTKLPLVLRLIENTRVRKRQRLQPLDETHCACCPHHLLTRPRSDGQPSGYGAMHLIGPGFWGPPPDPDQAVRMLRRTVELGLNSIDTADPYGPDNNERIIRKLLHPYPKDLVITTKGGMLRTAPKDWVREKGRAPYIVALGRPPYLRQQVELSLHKLGVERIDLYQLHCINPIVPLADQLGELVRLQQEGKIRPIGLSGQPASAVQQLVEAHKYVDIVAVENFYNIADGSCEAALRYAEVNGIAFIPWFPLGHGDLIGPYSALSEKAEKVGAVPAQVGLAWLLQQSRNTLLINGTSAAPTRHRGVRPHTDRLDRRDDCAHQQPERSRSSPHGDASHHLRGPHPHAGLRERHRARSRWQPHRGGPPSPRRKGSGPGPGTRPSGRCSNRGKRPLRRRWASFGSVIRRRPACPLRGGATSDIGRTPTTHQPWLQHWCPQVRPEA